ncbi:MAG: hypothetical protein LBG19_00390 [Prevotellaceae bacterium]|jgi:hypothetical protein|nr:hypothetical protein [Prevotellaceae bacterium]
MSSLPAADTTTNAYPWHTVLTSIQIGDSINIEKEYRFDYYAPPKNQNGSPDYRNYYVFGRGGGPEQDLFLPDPLADIPFKWSISGANTNKTLRQHYTLSGEVGKYFINRGG